MYPDSLFELEIGSFRFAPNLYGTMIAVGILAAFAVLYLYGKKTNVKVQFLDFIFYNSIAAILIGFGSAALFQATYNYLENPSISYIEHLKGGSITFIGGLIGGAAAFLAVYFIIRKRLDGKLLDAISLIPCCILVAHAFGRIGCFFVGCCHGIPTDSFWGVQFPHLSEKVYPTQLYEAIFLFIMFAVCSFLLLKKKRFNHNMSLYLVSYGIFRFLIEYIRGDDRGEFVKLFSPSQFWSLGMIALGVALYFVLEPMFKKRALAESAETADDGAQTIVEEASENVELAEPEPEEADSTDSPENVDPDEPDTTEN